jgi:hypothetical protein
MNMKRNLSQHGLGISLLICLMLLAGCSKGAAPAATDASISDSLKAAMYSDPELKNDRIDVSVVNGEVTLSGEVSSGAARLQAYKLANETPGVKKVNDMLQVKTAQAAQEPPTEPAPAPAGSSTPTRPRTSKAPASGSQEKQAESVASPTSAGQTGDRPAAPPAPTSRLATIPAGTTIRVQMIDSIDSAKNQVGDTFLASLDAPLSVDNEVVVPKGADIYVKLANAKTSGKFTGRSELQLELDHLKFQGKTYNLASSTYEQVGSSRGKDTAKKTAIGAAIGTAIGAIAGGGKGAAIGAGVGAGSGAASQIFMKGKQVKVPSETKVDFELQEPVEVSLKAR